MLVEVLSKCTDFMSPTRCQDYLPTLTDKHRFVVIPRRVRPSVSQIDSRRRVTGAPLARNFRDSRKKHMVAPSRACIARYF